VMTRYGRLAAKFPGELCKYQFSALSILVSIQPSETGA
jgi:hypothetical protein